MIKGTNAIEKIASGDASVSDEMRQLRDKAPVSILKRAVVVDVIFDPSLLTSDVIQKLSVGLLNAQNLESVPRNSIIARIISMGEDKNSSGNIICYPFFPPHLGLPVKPGEQVWVFFESPDIPQNIGFWMSRIVEPDYVDDLNYTHGDRRFDKNSDVQKTTSEKIESVHDASGLKLPGFFNGDPNNEAVTTLKKADDKDDPFDTIYKNSIAAKSFVMEPVPRFIKRPGDTILQGSNNTIIVLGQDRGWNSEVRPGESVTSNATQPDINAGTIDIVTGRARFKAEPDQNADKILLSDTRPRVIKNTKGLYEVDKNPTSNKADPLRSGIKNNRFDRPTEGDPDFVYDASRIYTSMKSNGDKNFNIQASISEFMTNRHGVVDIDAKPFIVLKSNEIRIIARHTKADLSHNGENGSIRIIREDEDGGNVCSFLMTHDGKILVDAKEIVLGDGRDNQIYLGDNATEPSVLGDTLEKMLTQFCNTAGQSVGNLGQPIPQLIAACNALKAQLTQFKSKVTKLK